MGSGAKPRPSSAEHRCKPDDPPGGTIRLNRPPVGLHNAPCNGQAHAEAAPLLPGAGLVRPIEAVEELVQFLGLYAGTGILGLEKDPFRRSKES